MGQVVGRAGRAGEVENVVHRPVDLDGLGNVVLDEVEPGVPVVVLDVPPAPRQQVVDAEDLVPLGQKTVAEMRPDEPRAPRNYRPHGSPPDSNLDRLRPVRKSRATDSSYIRRRRGWNPSRVFAESLEAESCPRFGLGGFDLRRRFGPG